MFQDMVFLMWYGMKINWDSLLGKILGLAFAVLLIKMFIAPEDDWWEIVGDMVRGIVGL